MNITVYLFGVYNDGYTQYPDDYTKSIFETIYENATSPTQITIHRRDNIMYYSYIRKLNNNSYIGLCAVINGSMLTDLNGLFSLYENVISTLVSKGQLIHFNKQGSIVTSVDKIHLNQQEYDFLTQLLQEKFEELKNSFVPLPAINFSILPDTIKRFSIKDNLVDIIKSSHTNGYTYISKSEDFNTSELNDYIKVITELENDKTELTNNYTKLKTEHQKTIKQKKQYRFVAILFLLVLGSLIGLVNLNSELKSTGSELRDANNTISKKDSTIKTKNSKISYLEKDIHSLQTKYENTKNNLNEIQTMLNDRVPFFITNTSFNFNTGYLSYSYYGFKEKSVKLQVRTYSDNGTLLITTTDSYVHIGKNTNTIYCGYNLDKNDWYSFVILYNNVIIGGNRH